MDDNKVAVLLEDLMTKFNTFGEGLENVQRQISEVNQKVEGLIDDMDIVKPTLKSMDNRLTSLETKVDVIEKKVDGLEKKVDGLETKTDGLIQDMDIVKPSLIKINNRLDNIEGEIIKINPESRSVLKQVK